MKKPNKDRGGCKDVFHAALIKDAHFAGEYGFPIIREEHRIPRKLIRFSATLREDKDFHQWVMFYEDDHLFERIWNCPQKYLPMLKRFDGVITPDFSLYYDMPLAMQIWNIYRSRAIGAWLQTNGVRVIPNIRFGSPETYDFVCDGISRHSVIAIGTLGCIKNRIYHEEFERGIIRVAQELEPEAIVFYGSLPSSVAKLKKCGIEIVNIRCDYSFFRKEGK